jgi:hypothetical protein
MKVKKSSIYIILLQIAFISILQIAYVHYIVPHYSDMHFTARSSPRHFVSGEIIFIVTLLLTNILSKNDFMLSILHMVISFFLAPNIVLFQYMQCDVMIVLGIVSIILWAFLADFIFPDLSAKGVKKSQRLSMLFMLTFLFMIPFFITFGFGISSSAFNLDTVYDIRTESNLRSNFITNYTYSLVSTWLLPLCLIFGYIRKNIMVIAVSIIGLLYMFAISGNRITLFTVLVVVAFLFFRSYRAKLLGMYAGMTVLLVLGLLFYADFPHVEDLLIRRFLFLPALLNIQYLDFFSGSPLFYSHSFLSGVLDYPFFLPPPRMIGHVYYGGEGNMTNGIVSDGFMNLGYAGIFFNAMIAGAIIAFFNKLKVDAVFFGLFFLLVQKFIDSAMFTALLTHGVLLFMAMSLLVITNTDNERIDANS